MKPRLFVIDGRLGSESGPQSAEGSWNREWASGEHGGDAFTTATAHVDIVNRRRRCGVRVFVAGSRSITDRGTVASAITQLPNDAVVLASRTYGVSAAARDAALARGLQLEVWSPLSERFASNEEAYFARDEEMIRSADRVIAFWDGASLGTAHELDYAQRLGKPIDLLVLKATRRWHVPLAPLDPHPGGDAA